MEISTIGRAVKLVNGMRADQESTRPFHQRRSSGSELDPLDAFFSAYRFSRQKKSEPMI
jgi:hypothetical protein